MCNGGYLGCVVEPVDDALHALLVVGHHLVGHAVGVHDLNRGKGGERGGDKGGEGGAGGVEGRGILLTLVSWYVCSSIAAC